MVSEYAGLGGASLGGAYEDAEERDELGRGKVGDRGGPEVGLPGANIIAETSECEDNEELDRECVGDASSLGARVGLGGAKTMLGRSSKGELEEAVEFMFVANIAGADGRRADKINVSSCVCLKIGEEDSKKSMNDWWSSLASCCREGISIGEMGGK